MLKSKYFYKILLTIIVISISVYLQFNNGAANCQAVTPLRTVNHVGRSRATSTRIYALTCRSN